MPITYLLLAMNLAAALAEAGDSSPLESFAAKELGIKQVVLDLLAQVPSGKVPPDHAVAAIQIVVYFAASGAGWAETLLAENKDAASALFDSLLAQAIPST
jgi:hypothetical protein